MTDTVINGTVILSDAAAAKVTQLLAGESGDLALRVAVQPGGCAGLRYDLYFDDQSFDGDVVTTQDDIRIVVDEKSAPYLTGATIDYADTISKQGFTIDNPNATGSCACGDSFN
ncbi:MAG: iron-sulfur cluster assembly accessory protein [Propionibacteriaceae bacterium]|nr:iron-sulfur cluster assembly accessory protein [Propionibacteriaceae bacterium]